MNWSKYISCKHLGRKIQFLGLVPSTKEAYQTALRIAWPSATETVLVSLVSSVDVMMVDQYIDSCLLMGIKTITIIHGKGTGALRNAIQQHLKNHKAVRSFRLGVYGEGENGVTIAELK